MMLRTMLTRVLPAALLALASSAAFAKVQSKIVEYSDGDIKLAGHLAWDDALKGKRPGILVVHEWWGLDEYARGRAEQLAAMGYVAFALDMYGKGKVTEHAQEAAQWSAQIRENVDKWQQRALLGLDILRRHELVDPQRTAAIGYCFGGATVIQLAYRGSGLSGVVSFHGSLPTPSGEPPAAIRPKILICHGADDAFIPAEQIQKFQEGLKAGHADWQMIYYANARHSFTNPAADGHGIDGLRYNQPADQRSWHHMKMFFDEIFAGRD